MSIIDCNSHKDVSFFREGVLREVNALLLDPRVPPEVKEALREKLRSKMP